MAQNELVNKLDQDRCWEDLVQKRGEGFLVGVITTGIFCRPTCPSRRPLRKNVRFFATAEEAQSKGLRACLRCRPLALAGHDPHTERIRQLCQYIEEHAAESLSLADLAARAALSPFHLQRSFKAILGVSPKRYLDNCRMGLLKTELRGQRDVTGAIFEVATAR